jgi:hypothetical protein
LPDRLHREFCERDAGNADSGGDCGFNICGLEWGLHRNRGVRGHVDCGGIGHRHVQHIDHFCAYGDSNGNRNGHSDQHAGWDQLPDGVLGEFCERNPNRFDCDACDRFDIHGLDECDMRRHRDLHSHDYGGDVRHSRLRRRNKQLCADGKRSRQRSWYGYEQSCRDQLPNDLLGQFCQRGAGHARAVGFGRIDIRGVERGLHGDWRLRGDHDCGGIRGGHI